MISRDMGDSSLMSHLLYMAIFRRGSFGRDSCQNILPAEVEAAEKVYKNQLEQEPEKKYNYCKDNCTY